jgi:hypothetical protein
MTWPFDVPWNPPASISSTRTAAEQVFGCGSREARQLDAAAQIGIATIRRIEGREGLVMAYVSTLMRIQSAFENAGIRFLDNDTGGGIGVKFSEQKK